MNAYELAKELESCFTMADWNVLEAAKVLRIQADRIAELEKDLHMVQRHNDQQDIKLLSHDEIWAYAHIHKISGDVVKFARAIEAKIRSEE